MITLLIVCFPALMVRITRWQGVCVCGGVGVGVHGPSLVRAASRFKKKKRKAIFFLPFLLMKHRILCDFQQVLMWNKLLLLPGTNDFII